MSISAQIFCDKCGTANRPQASFCKSCGQSLRVLVGVGPTSTGLLSHRTTLKQRYMILHQTGRGGFGAVYKAADSHFGNRLVAIKEMSQNSLTPTELIDANNSFKREAVLLAGLTHPNLPRIYDQFTDTGRSYLVMDFIEGQTLEAYLHNLRGKQPPMEKVFDIALQLCSVLEYLHTRQPAIIFRDLKPANVMLTSSGHIYLIDFGIARHFKHGQVKDTTALGSPGYAAPEQYGKSQTTARSDIYSLGATLHHLLTGEDPSDSPFQFTRLSFSDQPLLDGLDTLIMSMVSVDINKRPSSISAIKQELQRIAARYSLGQTNPLQTITIPPVPANTYPPPKSRSTTRGNRQATLAQVRPQLNTLYVCCGHSSRITALAWSPNGKHIASASYDKTVQIWDAASGNHLRTYKGHYQRVNALAWSPDSAYLASTGDDSTVHIWEAATGDLCFPYHGHQGPVHAVAWSPDGTYIASAGDERTVQVWGARTHLLMHTYRHHTNTVQALAWSSDGRHIASAGKDRKVHIWDPLRVQQKRSLLDLLPFFQQGQKELDRHQGPVHALAWSPDSRHLASAGGDHRVLVWDIQLGTITFAQGMNGAGMMNAVAWSPSGRHLAIGSNDRTVKVWNTVSKEQPFIYYGHTGYVIAVAWSPDGTRLASAGVDRTVQVWQAV
ncbi:MAG TPA: protein kinase [Ktedonosporobacter sp.]|nr:protein kinase [Ktedonosporobacter sp.]